MIHTPIKLNDSPKHSPRKSFIRALLVTSILLVILGWASWNSYKDFQIIESKLVRLQELVAVINTTDEVLTMSARMAAATGDLKWETRYLSFEPTLDEAIKEAQRILPDKALSEAIAKTDVANIALVKMEKQSFDLVRDNQREKASGLLFSDEYENQKRIYSKGMRDATKYIHHFIDNTLYGQRKRALLSFLSVVAVFLISIITWVFVLRLMEKYVIQRNEAEDALQKNSKALFDITSSVAEGLYVLNKNGNVIFMNPEAERLVGWTQEELMNRNIHNAIHCHDERGKELSVEECPGLKAIKTGEKFYSSKEFFKHKDGTTFPVSVLSSPITENGEIISSITAFRDITERKKIEMEKEKLIEELQKAMFNIKTLSGMLPICSYCKKIRDDKGYWEEVATYISKNTDTVFSHGMCPECAEKAMKEFEEFKKQSWQ